MILNLTKHKAHLAHQGCSDESQCPLNVTQIDKKKASNHVSQHIIDQVLETAGVLSMNIYLKWLSGVFNAVFLVTHSDAEVYSKGTTDEW